MNTNELAGIVDPKRSALIVVDVQNDNSSPKGTQARHGRDISMIREMIPRLLRFLEEARENNLLIIFLRNTVARDGLSTSPVRARLFGRSVGGMPPEHELEGTWGHDVLDELNPQPQEMKINKYRSSGFHGTSLDLFLRSKGVEMVIICGVVTEGCVESTVREASFYDYLPIVVSDCVASLRRDLHEAAMKVMTARYDVATSEEIIEAWESVRSKELV